MPLNVAIVAPFSAFLQSMAAPPPPPPPPPPPSGLSPTYPPYASMDFNLFLLPKLEPNTEPSDCYPTQIEPPCPWGPNALLPPNPNPEDSTLFHDSVRLACLLAASDDYLNNQRAIVPAPIADASAVTSANVAPRKRKARSAEMVRVSSLQTRDKLYLQALVRRTRITFDSLRYHLPRDAAPGEVFLRDEVAWSRRNRTDLKAATLMGDRELWLNRDRRIIGPIPGIVVGDAFFFRIELCLVGLHGQVQAGIDYVPANRSESGQPIATSIIVSGGYEDDDDKGVELIYTGHGGRVPNILHQCSHQKLEGGNLALERSMNYGIEIRVIRGIKYDKSPTGRVYFYDGLYKIVDYWMDVGKSGFAVYRYRLLRMAGQIEMGSEILKLANQLKANPLGMRTVGYLCLDISRGTENFPISVFNNIDDDNDPLLFQYITRTIFPHEAFHGMGNIGKGCGCTVNCSTECYCAQKNGGNFAYDRNGILLRGKPLVYECGASCSCPSTCPNRVSQKGIRYQFEVFRSKETGWGVRSLDLIQAGAFVCEFSGVAITEQHTKVFSKDERCCLVSPGKFPRRWTEWGDISDVSPSYLQAHFPPMPDLSFSIDVSKARNVACYLSHSSSPNVFVQFVLFEHYNIMYPHVMIFAMENIPPLRELSIDYGIEGETVGLLTM